MKKEFITLFVVMLVCTSAIYAQSSGIGRHSVGESVITTPTLEKSAIPTLTGDSVIHSTSYSPSLRGVIFEDDFSKDLGWTFLGQGERGVAVAGGSHNGNPDTDHTPTNDNYLAGTNISGDANLGAHYLATPPIDCSGQNVVNLNFWSHTQVSPNSSIMIMMSTDENNWHAFYLSNYQSELEWTKYSFNISNVAANSPTVYIRFYYNSRTAGYPGISIDDFSLTYPEQHDLGVRAITPTFIKEGTSPTPQVRIHNYGLSVEDNYNVQLSIEDENQAVIYNETANVSTSIQVGGEALIQFPAWTATTTGIYNMTATVVLSGDTYADNDLIFKSCIIKALPEEVLFEDDFSTDLGWDINQSWERAVATAGGSGNGDPADDHTPTNDGYLAGNIVGGDVIYNGDSEFISPSFDCSEQDVVLLNFWSQSQVIGIAKVRWFVSTDAGLTWNTVMEENLEEIEWTEHNYNISEFAAGHSSVMLSFVYRHFPPDSPGLSIDDVSVTFPPDTELSVDNIKPTFVPFGYTITPKVNVHNLGSEEATNFEVQLLINDANNLVVFDETVSVTALPILSDSLIAMPLWTPANEGVYSTTATVIIAGDSIPDNNTWSSECVVLDDIEPGYLWNAYPLGTEYTLGPNELFIDYATMIQIDENTSPFVAGADWINGKWYGCTWKTGAGDLVTINTTTGAVTTVGSMGLAEMTGLAYDVNTDVVYAVNYEHPYSKLYTVDIRNSTATFVGNIIEGIIMGIACDNDGDILGVDLGSYASLYSIDPNTGVGTVKGKLGGPHLNFAQDIAYDRNKGILYGALYDGVEDCTLHTINTSTGHATLLYTIGDELTGFAIPYSEKEVTFTVDNAQGEPIQGALINIGNGKFTATTDEFGESVFNIIYESDHDYKVTYNGCEAYTGSFTLNGENQDIAVRMYCVPGNVPSALQFDGSEDYAQVSDFTYPTSDLTVEAWVFPTQFNDIHEILFGTNSVSNFAVQFSYDVNGTVVYGQQTSDWAAISSTTPLELNHWNHVAVTRENGITKMYINGIPAGESDGLIDGADPSDIYLGGRVPNMDRMLTGNIDEVRIWENARTQTELNQYMYAHVSGIEEGLVSYWRMDQGEGQMVQDLSDNNFDLQLGSTAEIDDNDPEWVSSNWPYLPTYPPKALAVSDTGYATWKTPGGEWLSYDDGISTNYLGGIAIFSWAIKFDPDQLIGFDGSSVTKINIFCASEAVNTLQIFEGTNAETLIFAQELSGLQVGAWNEVALTSPVPIDILKELWISVYTADGANNPASFGADMGEPNGNLLTVNGTTWRHLDDYNFSGTWNLACYVTDVAGRDVLLGEINNTKDYDLSSDLLAPSSVVNNSPNAVRPNAIRSGELLGYNVYLDEIMITNTTDLFWKYVDLTEGQTYMAGVSATYEDGESETIEYEFTIAIQKNPPTEFMVSDQGYAAWETPDDGSFELQGYNLYLDGEMITTTSDLFWQYADLTPGETYMAGVSALYDEGESDIVEYEFTTPELDTSTEFMVSDEGYATWEAPDGGGGIYELQGYNVYLDGEMITTTPDLFWQYADLTQGQTYLAGVSALYDEGESDIVEYEFIAGGLGKIQGFVRDAVTNIAIDDATISATNADDGTITTETPFGSHYSMLLAPGSYDLSCSADGYETMTATNLEVIESLNTENTFYLVPTDGNELLTGVNGFDSKAIILSPNPARDIVNISGEGIKSLTIFNYRGQVMYQNEDPLINNAIDVNNLPSGIYLVRIETGNGMSVEKLVVE